MLTLKRHGCKRYIPRVMRSTVEKRERREAKKAAQDSFQVEYNGEPISPSHAYHEFLHESEYLF